MIEVGVGENPGDQERGEHGHEAFLDAGDRLVLSLVEIDVIQPHQYGVRHDEAEYAVDARDAHVAPDQAHQHGGNLSPPVDYIKKLVLRIECI